MNERRGVTPSLHLAKELRARARARGTPLDDETRERIAGYAFPFFAEAVFWYFKSDVKRRPLPWAAPWSPFGGNGRPIPLKIGPDVSKAAQEKAAKAIDLLFHPRVGQSLLAALREGYEFARQAAKDFPPKERKLRIPAALYAKWFEAILFPEDLPDWPEEEHLRPSDQDVFAITASNFTSMGVEVDEERVKKAFARWKRSLRP